MLLLGQHFNNVALLQGLEPMPTAMWGSSVSFHDFDHDGWDGLTFAVRDDSIRLYRNVEGTLQRLPSTVATPGHTRHVLWVDYDNDGHDDLFVTTFDGPCRLLRNNGSFQFTDVTVASGLPLWAAPHSGASFGDFDRDGYLDLYVTTYIFGVNETYPLLNHLYRNNGDGTFTDVTLAAGVGNGIRFSFQATWLDYDLDGWPDLYVINDRTPENTLYRNNGDGTFTDQTAASGTGFPSQEPMSLSVADFDHDGDLDIFMTNSGNMALPPKPCILLVNNGDGTFTDRAAELGVQCEYYGWGAVWVDIGNDTRLDIVAASSGITTTQAHVAVSDDLFQNSTAPLVGAQYYHTWTSATGDLNNDGHADVVVHALEGNMPELWLQATGSNHWIKITPQGTVSNRQAVGTWVRVHVGSMTYSKYTTCGANYLGQDSPHLIFGLGSSAAVDSVTLLYPSGHMDTYHQPAVDHHHLFTEGETYTAFVEAQGPLSFCGGGSVVLDAGEHALYAWSNGHTERFLTVTATGAYVVTVTNEFGIQAVSDTVHVVVLAAPAVLADVLMPSCAESADGAILLSDGSGSPPLSVTWSSGGEGPGLEGLAEGTYGYTYTDANGCTVTGDVVLVAPPALVLQVNSTPEIFGADGTLVLELFGGTPPYSVFVNGALAGLLVEGLSAGIYTVQVVDALGCSVEEEVSLLDATSVPEHRQQQVMVVPNPAMDGFRLKGAEGLQHVLLISQQGERVREWGSPLPGHFALGGLAAGAYQLLLHHADGTWGRLSLVKLP